MIRAEYFGKLGDVDRYYWVVAQFILADPIPIGPALVRTTNPLNNDNRVLLEWDYVPGATYYTVVQTVTSAPPTLQREAVAVIKSPTTITTCTDTGEIQDWYYPNPATGGSGPSGVSSWNGRTGNVLPVAGDYNVNQITGAVSSSVQIIAGIGLAGGGPLTNNVTLSVVPDTTLQKSSIYNSGVPIGQRSVLNLIGGAALTISATDNPGANWIDVVFSSKTGSGSGLVDPTVSKGDILVRNSTQVVRLPVGSDGQSLVSDSSRPEGVKWGAGAAQTPWLSDINGDGYRLLNPSGISLIKNPRVSQGDPFVEFNFGTGMADNSRIDALGPTLIPGYMEFTHNRYRDPATGNPAPYDPTKGSSLLTFARSQSSGGGAPFLSLVGYSASQVKYSTVTLDSYVGQVKLREGDVTEFGGNVSDLGLLFSKSDNTDKARLHSVFGANDVKLELASKQNGTNVYHWPIFSYNEDFTAEFYYYVQDNNQSLTTSNHAFFFDLRNIRAGIGKNNPAYALDVVGDVNISGTYRVNGTPISAGGGGGSQTPWTSNIDAAGFDLNSLKNLNATGLLKVSHSAGTNQGLQIVNDGLAKATLVLYNSGDSNPGVLNIDNEGRAVWINGAPISGGSPQTPWAQDINGGGHDLTNVTEIDVNESIWFKDFVTPTNPMVSIMNGGGFISMDGLKTDGNVSILTTNRTYPLNVAGDVNITGVYRVNGVPLSFSGMSDPTTTKGDLIVRSSSAASRLGVGTDGQVLMADSTQTLGVKWAASGGGSQTPWVSDIDGGGFILKNVAKIGIGSSANPTVSLQIATGVTQSSAGALKITATDSHYIQIFPSLAVTGNNGIVQAGDTALIFSNGAVDTGGFVLAPLSLGSSGLRMSSTGAIALSGNLTFSPDNTYDIGASGATRPKNLWLAGNITLGGSVTATSTMNAQYYVGNYIRCNDNNGDMCFVQHAGANGGNYGLYFDKTNEVVQMRTATVAKWGWDVAGVYKSLGQARPTILFDQGAAARSRILQPVAQHGISITNNAYFDGSNWQRDDTGSSSILMQFLGSNAAVADQLRLVYVPAGTGAIAYPATPQFAFDLANMRLGIGVTPPAYTLDVRPSVASDLNVAAFINTGAPNGTLQSIIIGSGLGAGQYAQAGCVPNPTTPANAFAYYGVAGANPLAGQSVNVFPSGNVTIGTITADAAALRITRVDNSDLLKMTSSGVPANYWLKIRGNNSNTGDYIFDVCDAGTISRAMMIKGDGQIYFNIRQAIQDTYQANGSLAIYVNESSNAIIFRVKYSNGTIKQLQVALT